MYNINKKPTPMTREWFEKRFGATMIPMGETEAMVPTNRGKYLKCHYVDCIDVPYIESILWISSALDRKHYSKRKIAQYIYDYVDHNAICVTRRISFGLTEQDYKYLMECGAINDDAKTDLRFHRCYGCFMPDRYTIAIECSKCKADNMFSEVIIHEFRHAISNAAIDGVADLEDYPEWQSIEDEVRRYGVRQAKQLPAIDL